MKLTRLAALSVVMALPLAGAANSTTDGPEQKFANIGAKMSGPYYQQGDFRAHVGFTIDLKMLRAAVFPLLKMSTEEAARMLDGTNMKNHTEAWVLVLGTDPEAPRTEVEWTATVKNDVLTLVASDNGTEPLEDTDELTVAYFGLDLGQLANDSQLRAQNTVVWQGEPDEGKKSRMRITNHAKLSVESTLAPEDTELVVGELNSATDPPEYKAANGTGSLIKVSYQDSLFPFTFSNSRVATLKFEGTVSELALDSRSSLELGVSGESDFLNLPLTVSYGGFKIRTSQSLHQAEFLIDAGWRLGDHRGWNTNENASFRPRSGLSSALTLEVGAEVGVFVPRRLNDGARVQNPDLFERQRLVARPYARLGFNEDSVLGGLFTLSGYVQGWYLDDQESKVAGTRFAERAELVLAHENNNGFTFGLSVAAGRNPADGFGKIRPEWGLSLGWKR